MRDIRFVRVGYFVFIAYRTSLLTFHFSFFTFNPLLFNILIIFVGDFYIQLSFF